MSPSPNTPDESPLARLRAAAARLNDEGPVASDNGVTATFAPRPEAARPGPQPEPARPVFTPPAPPAGPPPAWSAPSSPSYAPPAYAPPAYAPPAPAPSGTPSRTPLVVGSVVAAVLVVALIVVGLVAMAGDDDGSSSAAPGTTTEVTTATTLAPAPAVSEAELYAPLAGYTFAPLPEGALEVARSPFDNVPELRGTLDDLSGRVILRNGANTAIVFVYQFDERFLSIPGASDDFIDGITLISSEVEPVTVAGHEGVYFVYGSSHAGVAVLDGNVAVLVQGPFSTPQSRLESLTASFLGRTG